VELQPIRVRLQEVELEYNGIHIPHMGQRYFNSTKNLKWNRNIRYSTTPIRNYFYSISFDGIGIGIKLIPWDD
jgi:hypothetical protein